MKYRHSYHAGNFADVHKHVTLLALLAALKKKEKGFLYLETHAGRGSYDLSNRSPEAAAGIGRFAPAPEAAPELREYAAAVAAYRRCRAQPYAFPGSPLLACEALRRQDRAVLIELQSAEARLLEAELGRAAAEAARGTRPRTLIECGDGFARLRAFLPPPERRALTFLDPPFEESEADFARLTAALVEGLRRFPTGVFAAWYPIKQERSTAAWQEGCIRELGARVLASEIWLYPRDSRVALNGSGLLIVNPPWQTLERMQVWLPQLEACLAVGPGGGSRARILSQSIP